MTTLPNDPPVDDDDWSHEQTAGHEDVLPDPDDLAAYSDDDLDDADEADDLTKGNVPPFDGDEPNTYSDEDE